MAKSKKAPVSSLARPTLIDRAKEMSKGMATPIRSFVIIGVDEKGELGIAHSINDEMDLKQLYFHMDEVKMGMMQHSVHVRHEQQMHKAAGRIH